MTQPAASIPQNVAYTLLYQDGMFLTASEMSLAQTYFVNWLQWQNQFLYTPGVLSGLLVSNPSGNTLSATTGAGFDSAGHFVILPDGGGNTITVSPNATNPSFVGLVYPSIPPPVADMPYTVNWAGSLQLANTVDSLPANSILLAQINMTSTGGIDSVKDMRTAVTSRLPAVLTVDEAYVTKAALPSAQSRNGVAGVSGAKLRKQGDSVPTVVYYNEQQTAAFDQIPHVLVTVQGNLPYATAVSEIGPEKFTLTLTAVLAPAADVDDPIHVRWLAYV
ncbi:hypothetical protein [Dyella subtropica]|uniref:hypothetical protein n=1 Tax=Dyella subtropica TaxID=2992127 RepID=UPI00225A6701|nr:hypothetical protein [Dyella subtropica]